MPDKTYTLKGKEVTVTGSDELLAFIDETFTELTSAQSKPDFSQQLSLWKKAEPYYEAHKKKVDYTLSPVEVMRTVLEANDYDLADTDDKTVSYLFNKVLPAYVAPTDANNQGDKGKQNSGTNTKPPVTGIKPASGQGISSEELAGKIAEKRLEGSIK